MPLVKSDMFSSELDLAFYKLKKNAHYVASQKNAALFYFFGKKIILKGPFVHAGFERLVQLFKEGVSHSSLCAQLNQLHINPTVLQLITYELEQKGLMKITRSVRKQTNTHIEKNRDQIEDPSDFSDYINHAGSDCPQPKNILFLSLLGPESVLTIAHAENQNELMTVHSYICDLVNPLADLYTWPVADLYVVLSNGFQSSVVHKLNSYFYKNNKPWLLATIDGYGGTIGPYFKGMPCYNCYVNRRLANETDVDTQVLLENYFSRTSTKIKISDLILKPLLALIQLEAFKILFMPGSAQSTKGPIDIDFLNLKTKPHVLLPVPNCQCCSPFMRENASGQHYKNQSGVNENVQL